MLSRLGFAAASAAGARAPNAFSAVKTRRGLTTTTTTPLSSPPTSATLLHDLRALGKNPTRASKTLEQVSRAPLSALSALDLVHCLEAVQQQQAAIVSATATAATLNKQVAPAVNALLGELLKRTSPAAPNLSQLLLQESESPARLSQFLARFGSPTNKLALDARLAKAMNANAAAAPAALTLAQFELLHRAGPESRRALFANERHLLDFVRNLTSDNNAGLDQVTYSFLGSAAVDAVLLVPGTGEDVNRALQTLLRVALDRVLAVAPQDETKMRWIFQLFDANQRRPRRVDSEWLPKYFKEYLSQKLQNVQLEVFPKQSDYDVCTMALSLWVHPHFWLGVPSAPAFASALVKEICARVSRSTSSDNVHSFATMAFYLNETGNVRGGVLLQSAEDQDSLMRLGDAIANRMLAQPLSVIKAMSLEQMYRFLWDLGRSTKLDEVFEKVTLPYFEGKLWEEQTLKTLLKLKTTPSTALASALLKEDAAGSGQLLPVAMFEMFQSRLKQDDVTRLLPKLEAAFLASENYAEMDKLTSLHLVRMAKLFANSPQECRDKLWRQVVLANPKQFAADKAGASLAQALELMGKLDTYETDSAFQALDMDKKLDFAAALRDASNAQQQHQQQQQVVPKPVLPADAASLSAVPAENLVKIAIQSSADLDLVRSADELLTRVRKQGKPTVERSVATTICLRLEKHETIPVDAVLEQRVREILPVLDFAFLCRIAGSSPTRALRADALKLAQEKLQAGSAVQLSALDVFYSFNNFMPRFQHPEVSGKEDGDELAREQWLLNELAGQMLDLNLSNLSIKLMINALKTIKRIDESFPEFKIEYRDALLARLGECIALRAVEAPRAEDLTRTAAILSHFQLETQAKAVVDAMLRGPAGRSLATYFHLPNNAEEEVVRRNVKLRSFAEIESVMTGMRGTNAVREWVCGQLLPSSTSRLGAELNLVDFMRVTEWIALHEEEGAQLGPKQLEFVRHFCDLVAKRATRIEEPKLNPFELLVVLQELGQFATEEEEVGAKDVFRLAVVDLAKNVDFYLGESATAAAAAVSEEDVALLMAALESALAKRAMGRDGELAESVDKIRRFIAARPAKTTTTSVV